MNLAPMRYKDYVWPHNPETYTISFKRQVAVAKVPFGRYGMQDLGMSYRVMEGEGVFAGKGAYDEFKKLASVFYQGGPGAADPSGVAGVAGVLCVAGTGAAAA